MKIHNSQKIMKCSLCGEIEIKPLNALKKMNAANKDNMSSSLDIAGWLNVKEIHI